MTKVEFGMALLAIASYIGLITLLISGDNARKERE